MLPWMFRHFKVGPLVGKRTWGGLVGISNYPTLMDGGRVTAPGFAFWTPDEGFGTFSLCVGNALARFGGKPVDEIGLALLRGHDHELRLLQLRAGIISRRRLPRPRNAVPALRPSII